MGLLSRFLGLRREEDTFRPRRPREDAAPAPFPFMAPGYEPQPAIPFPFLAPADQRQFRPAHSLPLQGFTPAELADLPLEQGGRIGFEPPSAPSQSWPEQENAAFNAALARVRASPEQRLQPRLQLSDDPEWGQAFSASVDDRARVLGLQARLGHLQQQQRQNGGR